jgi:site-specific recombinase XerD
MRLDQLINQTLEELKQLGIAESTIKSYRYSAYSLIRNYCVKHGTNCYKPATLDSFLSAQKKRIENSEISKRHYRKLRRAVQMLHEIYQYGTLQWDYYSARSIYKSNDYFSLCLKEFLDAQHLSRGTIANLRTYILQFLCYIEHGNCRNPQGSMGNVLYALRLFFNYLKKNSLLLIDLSPILNKPAQRKKKILPCFTDETILKQIDIDTKEGKRDYAILFLASHTGLRAVDIANALLPVVVKDYLMATIKEVWGTFSMHCDSFSII